MSFRLSSLPQTSYHSVINISLNDLHVSGATGYVVVIVRDQFSHQYLRF
jgi:hypothetical protein